MTDRTNNGMLRAIIPALALADGVIHLLLDFVLFHGNFFGNPFPSAPRPGATPGGAGPRPGGPRFAPPLPLNELFLLNFVGALVLALLFLYSSRWPAARRWLLDIVMIGYEAITFGAWLLFGRPNPMGLGYLSKGIEIVLVVALAAHIWSMLPSRRIAARAS
jgi:hypothetical protein